jgi:hypothetical protein
MTHPMLEKVARAIADGPHPSEASYAKARAAVRALMEPDKGMVEDGKAAGGWADDYWHTTIVCPPEKAFRAMLLPLVEGEGE